MAENDQEPIETPLGGAASDESGKNEPPVEDPPAEPGVGDPPADPPAHVRPEGLADEFWSDENGVNFEALLGQMTELQTFKAEADVRATGVPENAEAYALVVPEDLDLPEGVEVNIAEDDPMLLGFKTWAHQVGLSQDQFNGATSIYMQAKAAEAKQLHEAVAKQRELLGENSKGRVDAVMTALQARVGKDLAKALAPMMYTADQVKAMETLIRGSKAPTPPPPPNDKISAADWEKMSPDQKLAAAHENARKNGQIGPSAAQNR